MRNSTPAPPPANLLDRASALQLAADFARDNPRPVIALSGPTASGKTSLSIALAQQSNGEVISTDSRQFYRGFDIGTAKVTEDETQSVPHHLLDFLQPEAVCSSVEFCRLATAEVAKIHQRKALPLLVGGSSLLVQTLIDGWQGNAVPPDPTLRAAFFDCTAAELTVRLQTAAPQLVPQTDTDNPRRLIRALELAAVGVITPPANAPPNWQSLLFVLWLDPKQLRERIATRATAMWESGFLAEVEGLAAAGCTLQTPAMEAHGYREALLFLRGQLSREAALTQMITNTCRYAKRQRSWWRRLGERVVWVDGA